ncbi:MAG TPA: hypothetical protein VFM14_12625 [Gemmatimonadales bacterium]|nr:hypothetical protein [Gemmatimonadales bacterium]
MAPEHAGSREGCDHRAATQGPEQLRRSIAELQRAVALDPSFAEAWASLARARLYLDGPDSATLHAVSRALDADSMLPAVRLAAGLVASYFTSDSAIAVRHFEAGLAASPNNAELLTALAWERFNPKRPEESLAIIQRAQTLDPLSSRVASRLFRALCRVNRRREAISAADHLARLAPRSEAGLLTPITARLAAGEEAEALGLIAKELLGPDSTALVTAIQNGPYWLVDGTHLNALLSLPLSAFGGDRIQRERLQRSIARLKAIPDSSPDPEDERRDLDRKLAAEPDHPGLLVGLAHQLAEAGDTRGAHEALERLKRAIAQRPPPVGPEMEMPAI